MYQTIKKKKKHELSRDDLIRKLARTDSLELNRLMTLTVLRNVHESDEKKVTKTIKYLVVILQKTQITFIIKIKRNTITNPQGL